MKTVANEPALCIFRPHVAVTTATAQGDARKRVKEICSHPFYLSSLLDKHNRISTNYFAANTLSDSQDLSFSRFQIRGINVEGDF